MFVADLQLHSKYSRATSDKMVLEELARYAAIKGLDILGTGDISHPVWVENLKKKLSDNGNGIYSYENLNFVLQGEISLIYKQGGKQRRVHHVYLAPNFEILDQVNEWLDKKGRRDYDGRPIFGFSSIEFVEALMQISRDIEIIPAHAWTSWYSIFGSKSGFDSVEECFEDKAKHIHAIETGISSDPAMNWRLSQLDKFTLVSNSDAHSPYPWRLGREANVFGFKEVTYENIINAIRKKKDFSFTIETFPEYGKYHIDGHRNCGVKMQPEESNRRKKICPKCGKEMTIGVLNRVEELADRPHGYRPKGAVDFKTLLPLSEVIAALHGTSVYTKKVWEIYNLLIDRFGNEFNILLDVPAKDLEKTADKRLASLVIKNRNGSLKIDPGFDGVYGKVVLSEEKDSALSDFL